MDYLISEKISLLNQTTLGALAHHDVLEIVEKFTQAGLKVLGADYGFAWWKTGNDAHHHLVYKSPRTPYEPNLPRSYGANFEARKTGLPFFVPKVASGDYEKRFDISPYMKSYVVIPIAYKGDIYGTIVICYKHSHIFTDEDRVLSSSLGNSAAQSITIGMLLKKEREALRELSEQEARAKEAKMRTEFISNAAHELRTPLAIIKGNIDLALYAGVKSVSGATKTIRAINHETKRLTKLIGDMMLLTSAKDFAQRKFVPRKIDLCKIIEHTAKRYQTLADKKAISIETGGFPDAIVRGNRPYLDRLFANVIKNAITYGKEGGHIRIAGSESGKMVRISVSDDGIGIPKKDLSRIFERFYRTATARAENSGGTGLGLAMAKQIAEVHGGSMSVESKEGKGSSFHIHLPTA